MDHSSAYGNFPFPYNSQPQRFDFFCEPFCEHSLQQPPLCCQPNREQPPWLVQQELSHWNQYDELEEEEFQTEQSWQPTFCNQWQQGIPASEIQGLTTQVAQLVAAINKLTRKAEEEKGAAINEAPLMVVAAPEFQEIKCPTTSVTAYCNPSFIDSHSALNFDDDDADSLMSDDCMDASVDISECVCEPYDHNYTDADFEKSIAGFRELALIRDCNSFVVVPISDLTTSNVQLSDNVYYDGDESTKPHSEIDCIADLKIESAELEVQIHFRKSKEYLKKMREAVNHVLVLQYYEMDFDADVCEPEIDFTMFDHVHDVPVEVVDFNPCFDQSNIINSALSIDRVHIPASSVFDDCTYLNALLDDELDAYDDRYAAFDDVKVDMTDFENACTDLGLELELEFVEFLNSVELGNEKLNVCTCLRGGCEICEEISSAICSTSNCFAGAKEKYIMCNLDGYDSNEATDSVQSTGSGLQFDQMQINVDNLVHVESETPSPNILIDMPGNFELVDANFAVNQLNTPTDGCSIFNAVIFYDLLDNMLGDFDFSSDRVALFDDSPIYSDFGVIVDTLVAELNKEEAAKTKATLVEARDGVKLAQGVLNVHNQLPAWKGELILLEQVETLPIHTLRAMCLLSVGGGKCTEVAIVRQ
ncbi:hypothetical protein V8G54_037387 [Vigna mungo]|uniref:Uncharacterized protein n=1 Tax=Vigna mungo TaxID=3915 RepID=A0AAQ3RGF9_VIGMU